MASHAFVSSERIRTQSKANRGHKHCHHHSHSHSHSRSTSPEKHQKPSQTAYPGASYGSKKATEDDLDQPGDPIADDKLKEIERLEKNAVVLILIKKANGEKFSRGTGTFVSSDGHMITNFHIGKYFINNQQLLMEATTVDGRKSVNYEIIDCQGKDGDDLCLLKLELKPSHWFHAVKTLKNIPPFGEKLYMIGHPGKKTWDVRAGISLGKLTKLDSTRSSRLEVTVPVRPGFSGGPIFNERGELVCIASDRYSNSNLDLESRKKAHKHFCVDGEKIRNYLQRASLLQ